MPAESFTQTIDDHESTRYQREEAVVVESELREQQQEPERAREGIEQPVCLARRRERIGVPEQQHRGEHP